MESRSRTRIPRLMSERTGHSDSGEEGRSLMERGYAMYGSQFDVPFAEDLIDPDNIVGAIHARCHFSPVLAARGTFSTHSVSACLRVDRTREKVYSDLSLFRRLCKCAMLRVA